MQKGTFKVAWTKNHTHACGPWLNKKVKTSNGRYVFRTVLNVNQFLVQYWRRE